MNRKVDPEVVEILRVVRICQNMNALPRAGGILDQDAYFVFLLEVILLADQKKAEIDQARMKAKG